MSICLLADAGSACGCEALTPQHHRQPRCGLILYIPVLSKFSFGYRRRVQLTPRLTTVGVFAPALSFPTPLARLYVTPCTHTHTQSTSHRPRRGTCQILTDSRSRVRETLQFFDRIKSKLPKGMNNLPCRLIFLFTLF